jgi:hypothetical protein
MTVMTTRHQLERELSLPEMFADPIVQAVIARDGIMRDELKGLIGAVQGKLASNPTHV